MIDVQTIKAHSDAAWSGRNWADDIQGDGIESVSPETIVESMKTMADAIDALINEHVRLLKVTGIPLDPYLENNFDI